MNHKPLISIIVPAYNAQSSIEKTLSALLTQSYDNIEVICVNDGSTDFTGETIERLCLTDERITHIKTPNQGVFKARNTGIEAATGEYIGFCDADDEPCKNMYEMMVQKALATNADITICAYERKTNGHVTSTEMAWPDKDCLTVTEDSGWLASVNTALWNKLIKAPLVKTHIYLSKPPRIMEDALFLFSIYPNAKKIAFIPEALYSYHFSSTSEMNKITHEDLVSLFQCWEKTRDRCLSINPSFREVLDWGAFIHLGVSCTLSLVKSKANKDLFKKTKMELDSKFPTYKKSKFATLGYLASHRETAFMPFVAHKFFTIGLLPSCFKAYSFLSNKFGIEVKW